MPVVLFVCLCASIVIMLKTENKKLIVGFFRMQPTSVICGAELQNEDAHVKLNVMVLASDVFWSYIFFVFGLQLMCLNM